GSVYSLNILCDGRGSLRPENKSAPARGFLAKVDREHGANRGPPCYTLSLPASKTFCPRPTSRSCPPTTSPAPAATPTSWPSPPSSAPPATMPTTPTIG